jgi:hypothetical protein
MPELAAAPPAARAALQARRAMVGGLALWREGLVAESHVYMAAALRSALRAWAPVDAHEATPPIDADTAREASLAALGRAGYKRLDRLRAALAAPVSSGPAPGPELDWIWDEVERLCRFTTWRLASPRTRRRRRLGAGAAVAVLLVIGLVTGIKLWSGPIASASDSCCYDHAAALAVDGVDATEWLLPDRTPGWLQVSFRSPRGMHRVHLLNSHNRHYMDRASERVRVTAFSDEGPVGSVEGRFDSISPEPSALDLPLVAEHVTYLRIDVLSYFRNGGGLAEVEVR